ncbi:MAG TPA: hypothetical protein VGN90_15495 [Pyrinomonadaceae bacterium]|nr:hypothetical protein [Pyrinomonadaceae bacterium]
MSKLLEIPLAMVLLAALASVAFAQTPTPTPDKRGLGVESSGVANNQQTGQQPREAKPELVLQTGYNNFFGATRLVFSPDGRLLATATFRSSTIKLWETATGRELRNLSSGKQSAMGMSPAIAFSRDSRLVAAAGGENTVKVWDVTSGREVQTLTSGEGGMAASLVGVYFVAFSSNDRLVTIGDAVRVWGCYDRQYPFDNRDRQFECAGADGWRWRRRPEPGWNATRARFNRSGKPGQVFGPRNWSRNAHSKPSG